MTADTHFHCRYNNIQEMRNIPEIFSLGDDAKSDPASDSNELPDDSSFSLALSRNI